MCLEVPQKKSWKKSENCTSYATFKNYWFFTKFSSGYFWEESNFLTKSSLKWVKFDQWTSKMALMRDYTIVSEKMKLKLGKNAKYTPKNCPKLKKNHPKISPNFGHLPTLRAFLEVSYWFIWPKNGLKWKLRPKN